MEAYTAAGSGPLPPALSFFIVHGGKRSEATEADQATSLRHWAGEAQTVLRHAVELVAAKCCGRAEQLANSGSSIASGSNCRHALSRRWEERDSTQQEVNIWCLCSCSVSSLSFSLHCLNLSIFSERRRRRRSVDWTCSCSVGGLWSVPARRRRHAATTSELPAYVIPLLFCTSLSL
jgi:hypothetical protein